MTASTATNGHSDSTNGHCMKSNGSAAQPKSEGVDVEKQLLAKEPVLPVADIQGDIILGFNKAYNLELLLSINVANGKTKAVSDAKDWLRNTLYQHVSTTQSVISHRRNIKECYDKWSGTVFVNVSFSYTGLVKLLEGTKHELSLNKFERGSAFVTGAKERAGFLGDELDIWEFGKDGEADLLLNIASDQKDKLEEMRDNLLNGTDQLFNTHEVLSYRGAKGNDVFFGHEHFGFLDGLSQPEVRGTFVQDSSEEKKFIVRRRLCPNDPRFAEYARPGFRLMDPGHFLLGHVDEITDLNDPGMQNPDPARYRTLEQNYPSWCKNGTFTVFRQLQQDVGSFWTFAMESAKELKESLLQKSGVAVDDQALKGLAGDIAAKVVGRWWDGTPLSFRAPLTSFRYPPSDDELLDKDFREEIVKKKNALDARSGLRNGFQFDTAEAPWDMKGNVSIKPPCQDEFLADSSGLKCPFAGHIRKVNPRDQFTDIGSDVQTLRHRIIRRGNNYGTRVQDVFAVTENEAKEKRGLALRMYMSSIEDQFEFIQRHWANSSSRPKSGGDDMVIGQPASTTRSMTYNISTEGGKKVTAASLETKQRFVKTTGMGYFITPTKPTILEVMCAPPVNDSTFMYNPPANQFDFKDSFTHQLWDWTARCLFWQAIWAPSNTTNLDGQIVLPTFADMGFAGIAYRLPEVHKLKETYDDLSQKSYLQFRPAEDIHKMAELLQMTEPVRQVIAWQGFPKRLLNLYENSDVNPYEEVEKLGWPSTDLAYKKYPGNPLSRQMDEYCEWYTHRNAAGKITRIDLTCESPEYWTFLFKHEPNTAVELYRHYVSAEVTKEDLCHADGSYNVYNKWNTTHGAMHLNNPHNSLAAEVIIAGESAVRWGPCAQNRKTEGGALSAETPKCEAHTKGADLIRCGDYGLSTRASDPTIGASVNALVRSGHVVSLANPVGLYMEDLDTTGWQGPDGRELDAAAVGNMVRYERGSGGMNVRVCVEVPKEAGYVLGDCCIAGAPIQWSGQVVDASITVFLTGIAVPGDSFVCADAAQKAVVPCKAKWTYSEDVLVGPLPRNDALFPMPVHPVAGVNAKTREDDLKSY